MFQPKYKMKFCFESLQACRANWKVSGKLGMKWAIIVKQFSGLDFQIILNVTFLFD